jgi:hypothetical protein
MVLLVFFGGHEVLLSVNYDPTFKLNQCISTLNFSFENKSGRQKKSDRLSPPLFTPTIPTAMD